MTLTGHAVFAACQWGMVVLLAKVGTAEELGRLVYALAISAPVIVLCNLQLRVIQAVDTDGRNSFGEYFGVRILGQLCALLALAGWCLLSGISRPEAEVVLLVASARAAYALGETFYGQQQLVERMHGIAWSMAAKGVGSLAALAVGLVFLDSLALGLLGWSLFQLLALLVVDLPITRRHLRPGESMWPVFQPGRLYSIARSALPMGVSGLLLAVQLNISTYVVRAYADEATVGIFGALVFLTIAGRKVVEAMVRSAGPRLAWILSERRFARFAQLRRRLVLFATILGGAGFLLALSFGSEILTLLYQPSFAAYTTGLLYVIAGDTASYASLVFEHANIAKGKWRAQAVTLGVAVAATGASAVLLVPSLGILGGCQAIAIGGASRLLANLVITAREGKGEGVAAA